MELYQLGMCPYCERVRNRLDRLDLEYEKVEVPRPHEEREEVFDLSGQRAVPVLVDGGTVVHDSTRILSYLDREYGN